MGLDRSKRIRQIARLCYGAVAVLTLSIMLWIAWWYFGLTAIQVSDAQRRALVNYSHISPDIKPLPTPTTPAPVRSTTLATEETSVNSISKLPTTASVLRGLSRGESYPKTERRKEADVISSLAKGDFASRDRAHAANATSLSSPKDAPSSAVSPPRGPPRNKDTHISSVEKAAILTGSSGEDSEEDRIYARRVLSPGAENRPEEKSEVNDRPVRQNPPEPEADSRYDISPTKVHDVPTKSGSSRRPEEPTDRSKPEDRTEPRDYDDRDKAESPRRDEIQTSRRPDTESVYRDPDFDKEYPRRRVYSSDRDRPLDDDFEDEKGSRGKYDKRDRGRESDDRYSKGDTRVYPDDRGVPLIVEERPRSRVRERFPDDKAKRGDDDRYDDRRRDYDERSRQSDRDSTRYKDRDLVDRPPVRDDRYRDEERYRTRYEDSYKDRDDEKQRSREDRYIPRDDDRYRDRDEDRYRDRDDERYRSRDDDRYKYRDDERSRSRDDERPRPRDDDRYRPRDDDKYRDRDDDRYRSRDDDRYRPRDDKYRDDDRYRSRDEVKSRGDPEGRRDTASRFKDEKDEYRSRTDDDKFVESSAPRLRDPDIRESVSRSSSVLPVQDRKPTSSHSEYNLKAEETVTDYDIPVRERPRSQERDEISPSRLPRPSYYDEERYRSRGRDDDYRRPSRYEDEVKDISPTKTREEIFLSRSPLIDSRPKGLSDDSRYAGSQRDRIRDDDRYYGQDDRIRSTRIEDSRSSVSAGESSRRLIDDSDRYRTRLPTERIEDPKLKDRKEEVVLDRRSYASEEEEEEYRRRDTRRGNEDRSRRPSEDTGRRYKDEEGYSRRDLIDDEEYEKRRTSDDYDRDRSKSRDRYDDEYRRRDDRYDSRDEDRYAPRGDRPPPLPVRRYDTRPDDDERARRRDPDLSNARKDDSRDRVENLRPSSSSRDEDRFYSRDEYIESKPPPRRRYDDDLSPSGSSNVRNDYSEGRRYSEEPRRPVNSREPMLGSSMGSVNTREPSVVVIREKRFQTTDVRHENSRDNVQEDYPDKTESGKSREQVRPLSAKDVIEAAIRHSDASDSNSRKVYYPVFDPRLSNLTSTEIIRPDWRRGTTITAKKKRSV